MASPSARTRFDSRQSTYEWTISSPAATSRKATMRAVAGAFGAPPKATDAFGAHEWFIMQTSQERPVEKEGELLMNGACRVCRGPSKDRLRPVASSEGAPPAGLGTTTATWSNACCPHPVWSSVSEPLTSCRLVQECEADEAAKRVAAGHACKAANQPNETPPDSSTCTPRPKSRRNLGEISEKSRPELSTPRGDGSSLT